MSDFRHHRSTPEKGSEPMKPIKANERDAQFAGVNWEAPLPKSEQFPHAEEMFNEFWENYL